MDKNRIYQMPFGFKIDLEMVSSIKNKIEPCDKEISYTICGTENIIWYDHHGINDDLEAQKILDDFISAWVNYKENASNNSLPKDETPNERASRLGLPPIGHI